jgi:hypothetical protein
VEGISTGSRQNLSMRMLMRRFARFGDAHLKNTEEHVQRWCSISCTKASANSILCFVLPQRMARRLSKTVWKFEDLLKMIDWNSQGGLSL